MIRKLFKSVSLFVLLSVLQAKADYSQPACVGQQIDQSVRGTYVFDQSSIIGEDSITLEGGIKLKAWTCLKNGILIFVLQFPNDGRLEYESRAIGMSGNLLLDFGQVVGDVVNPFDPGKEAPLSKEGISQLMRDGLVKVVQKN